MNNQSYYDTVAKTYAQRESLDYHRFLNNETVQLLETWLPDGKILDAGCGCGHIQTQLNTGNLHVTGIDLSMEMLQQFNSQSSDKRIQGTLAQLPFANETFDGIYCLRVLPHITQPEKILTEFSRVLKPNGILIAEFYNHYSLRYLMKIISKLLTSNMEHALYTRYDSIKSFQSFIPPSLTIQATHGLRIAIATGHLLKHPGLGKKFKTLDKKLQGTSLRNFAGFTQLKLVKTP